MRRPDQFTNSTVPLALATAFGAGYVPLAPGTVGSAAGLLLWFILPSSQVVQGAAIVALFAIGSWSGSIAERHFHTTDPGPVVIDEVMGMIITLFMNPGGWTAAFIGFLLFRIFDIVKPYPTGRLERLPGGVGIMADDAMAAIYANLTLRAIWLFGNRVIS